MIPFSFEDGGPAADPRYNTYAGRRLKPEHDSIYNHAWLQMHRGEPCQPPAGLTLNQWLGWLDFWQMAHQTPKVGRMLAWLEMSEPIPQPDEKD